MKKFITYVGVCIATLLIANAQSRETRNLEPFDEIRVSESINVRLAKGSTNKAVVETRGVDVDRVETRVEGSTLYIRMRRGNYFSRNVDIELTYSQELEAVSVSSSASIIGTDVIATENFGIKASSSGRANLMLNVRRLDTRISSSADVKLEGKAKYQDIEVSSSGDLDAFDLDCEEAEIRVSSSGKAELTVHGILEGRASSSGKIYYRGTPDKVYVDTSSSGKVRKD